MEQSLEEPPALLTDLYQLTMAACYFDQGMAEEATFSLLSASIPLARSTCRRLLAEAFHYLETLEVYQRTWHIWRSTGSLRPPTSITWGRFASPARFSPFPRGASFSRRAYPGGERPILEAQLAETFIINAISLDPDRHQGVPVPVCRAGTAPRRFFPAAHPGDGRRPEGGPGLVSGRVCRDQQRAGGKNLRPSHLRHHGPLLRQRLSPGDEAFRVFSRLFRRPPPCSSTPTTTWPAPGMDSRWPKRWRPG